MLISAIAQPRRRPGPQRRQRPQKAKQQGCRAAARHGHQGGIAVKDKADLEDLPGRDGGSQAARLPKELRIEALEAVGHREGDLIVLRAAPVAAWPKGYWESFGPVGDDFTAPEPLPRSAHRDRVLEGM